MIQPPRISVRIEASAFGIVSTRPHVYWLPRGLVKAEFLRRAPREAGVTGVLVIRTSKGASASSTAFAIAAGGEMAPPSPRPLRPSGLRGEGNSR